MYFSPTSSGFVVDLNIIFLFSYVLNASEHEDVSVVA